MLHTLPSSTYGGLGALQAAWALQALLPAPIILNLDKKSQKSKITKIAITPSILLKRTWNFLCKIKKYILAIVKYCFLIEKNFNQSHTNFNQSCFVQLFTTRRVVVPPENYLILWGTSICSFRHLEHHNPSIISDFIGSRGKNWGGVGAGAGVGNLIHIEEDYF